MKAVEHTKAKGNVLVKNALETHIDKGSVLVERQWKHKERQCLTASQARRPAEP